MNANVVNGVVLNDTISEELALLQGGYARVIADELDESIGFLLEQSSYFDDKPKVFLDLLKLLHVSRTVLLNLIPKEEKGGAQ